MPCISRANGPRDAAGDHLEGDLVQRCLEGDPIAWDALVRTYWKRVFNIAYKFVAQYDEAEDLTQEVFVKFGWAFVHAQEKSKHSAGVIG